MFVNKLKLKKLSVQENTQKESIAEFLGRAFFLLLPKCFGTSLYASLCYGFAPTSHHNPASYAPSTCRRIELPTRAY